MTIEVYIDAYGEIHKAGILRRHSGAGRERVTYEHDAEWIKSPDAYQFDPTLPLRAGTLHPGATKAMFGTLGDSAPDTWGRSLMRRRERREAEREGRQARTLHETDYLLGVSDETRLGGIRFCEGGIFQSPQAKGVPSTIALGDLLQAAQRIESGEETDEDLMMIFAPGSSLGGARPKASVFDQHGNLSIAKFPKQSDDYSVERWEAIAMDMAKAAGLEVADHELVQANGHTIFLSRRFDRIHQDDGDDHRIPFMSAMAVTEHNDGDDTCSYLEIVDAINERGSEPIRDRAELFRRMAFTILISNTDDHFRNHGFLWSGRKGWRLYHRAECLTHVGDSQAVRSLTQCGEPMRFAMAAPIDLRNDFDSVSLRRLAKRTRDATQSRRLLALAEVYDGGSRTDASRIGGVGLQIIRDWVLRFNARGPDGLVDGKSPGAPSKLNADHRRALAEVVEAGPVPAVDGVVRWRRKDLARWLLETFAISLDETTVGRELKALGFAKISARPRHYAQNELAVEAFKKNFPAELAKIRARLPKGVEIELWWQDEARIGQKNKLTRRWARRGTRPRAPRDQRTEWAYIFGAICPAKGKGAGLVMPWCDTDAMAAHLIEISAAVDPGAHAVLIVDQAGWHLTPKLAIPDNITVLALPPRSPELNPVENVWQFMRDNWLSNRIFKSYEDIVALCCQAWNNLIDQPWKIMSLGMRKWAHGF